MRTAALALVMPVLAAGHGAITHPPSRNAVDGRGPRALSPWKDGKTKNPPPFGGYNLCAVPGSKDPKTVLTTNGQACYYFSNGCSHGCPACDTVTRGPIPGMTQTPGSSGFHKLAGECQAMTPFPKDSAARAVNPCVRKMDVCGLNHSASICASDLRTYNVNATCGADDDWYYFAPWRAPGSAPVLDSCGMAGGRPWPPGDFGATFHNTSNNVIGDKGTEVLPKAPSGVSWAAGSIQEVSWTIEANHGGGYHSGRNRYGIQGVHLNPLGLFLGAFIPCVWSILSAFLPP